jgi:hypothetical protein
VENSVQSPRPFFEEGKEAKHTRTIYLGTKVSGNVVKITKEGIEINGYYENFAGDVKYATLRDFVKISWESLEKMKSSLYIKKSKRKVEIIEEPDEIDRVDESYLKRLPIVTMNGRKFYIDPERRERRPVENPSSVFYFRKIFEDS